MREERNLALPFEEELLSGYLDGALTQQDTQRVRVHLEGSAEASRLLEELRTMREASMSTSFEVHEDRQWREAGRTAVSRASRGLGLVLLLVWAAGTGGFALWHVAQGSEDWWEKALVFGGVGAVALLFLSALLDRVRDSRTDRYKEVEK